mmetsp:Transcript_15816/g.30577  ORF Transcript_15816/g.30577 Transcript_15816/m.30577 type:complete len:230 (+) Transcript_15816:1295-1984(+)
MNIPRVLSADATSRMLVGRIILCDSVRPRARSRVTWTTLSRTILPLWRLDSSLRMDPSSPMYLLTRSCPTFSWERKSHSPFASGPVATISMDQQLMFCATNTCVKRAPSSGKVSRWSLRMVAYTTVSRTSSFLEFSTSLAGKMNLLVRKACSQERINLGVEPKDLLCSSSRLCRSASARCARLPPRGASMAQICPPNLPSGASLTTAWTSKRWKISPDQEQRRIKISEL